MMVLNQKLMIESKCILVRFIYIKLSNLFSSQEGILPTFIQQPFMKHENDGKRLIFECKISAQPRADIFWSRDNVPIEDSGRYLIYCDALSNDSYVACLEIDDVNVSDAGRYRVLVKNKLGENNAYITLNMDSKYFIGNLSLSIDTWGTTKAFS